MLLNLKRSIGMASLSRPTIKRATAPITLTRTLVKPAAKITRTA